MKFNVLNNEPLQFFDANGVLIGTIEISGSGDMVIRPESGSSRDIILGNRDTVGDVEIGLPSAAAGLKFMGGGTISANGNTLTIGDAASGDSVVIAVPITASNVISSSYAISASHLIGGGGGGGVPAGTVSGSTQITLLGFVTSSATASFVTNSQTASMSVLSSSFAVTSSHALTAANAGTTVVANPGSSGGGALSTVTIGGSSFSVGGGGGGSSIFTASAGFQKTINNLIVSQSNTTSSLTVINSGSTVFDVRGSVGQLFEVQDGLDGVLMSVNDVSGIPILTVSSSGDVFLAAGSTLQGTAATASFVAGVSAAFPFAGSGVITGSLDITGSGDDIFKVRSRSGSLFSVDDGLDGILMSVNDISGLPLLEVSSSGLVNIVTGNISGSGISTASFGKILVNGTDVSSSLGGGGSAAAGTVSGSAQITQLGFVTSSATASFITAAQTASFMTSSTTGSFNNLIISNLSGSLIPGNGSTSSIAVTVVSTGGGNKYALGGTITASISLTAGNSYKFDQSDATNAAGGGHPFRFSTDTGGSSNYSTGVTISGTPGDAGAFVQISVTNSTPTLYYYCTNHANMGLGGTLSIITGSLIQNGFLEVSGSTRLSGSLDVLTDITASGNISSSGTITAANFVGVSAFPFTGDAEITGSLTVSGSFIPRGAGVSHISNVSIGQDAGPGLLSGGQYNVIVGSNAGENLDDEDYGVFIGGQAARYLQFGSSTPNVIIGGLAGANLKGQLGVGSNDIKGNVFLGYGAGQGGVTNNTMAVQNNVGIGYNALNSVSGGQNNIALGYQAGASISGGDSNIIIGSGSLAETGTTSQLRIGHGTSTVISASLSTGHVILSGSTGGLELIGSGSTLFEVIGSEGTIFSLDDDLDGELFTVNDRSGIPQLLVSSSGRIEAEEGEAVIRSQRPIVTVATNPFTASADTSGKYFRVGGNITCSIFVTASAHCPIGAEFDFFQTSSVGNMLFETGSGVTLNSKNSNLNLAGQFSSATLKYIGLDEWDLMGDLT